MPQASNSSRTTRLLALILAISLAGLLGMVALTEHGKAMAALRARSLELTARRDAHLIILADREKVAARDKWILASQPALGDAATASSNLLEFVKETAASAGVALDNTKLLEPATGPAGPEIGIELKATTPFDNAIKLLHALQAPERFTSIAKFSIKSDAEPPNVVLELRLVRHYSSGTASQ